MSDNPYATPSSPGVMPTPTKPQYVYRSARMLVTLVVLFFLCSLVLDVLLGIMSIVEGVFFLQAFDESADLGPADLFYVGYACLGLASLVVYLVCSIVFCFWIYRANANARALGAVGMKITPGWSVGWFFIPFANLFMPYQAATEIDRASDPLADSTSWVKSKTSALFGWWWALWLIGNFLGSLEGRLAMSDEMPLLQASAWVGLVSGVLAIPGTLLAIAVVRRVHRRQEAKLAMLSSKSGSAAGAGAEQLPPLAANPFAAEQVSPPAVAQPMVSCPACQSVVSPNAEGRCPNCQQRL